MSRSPKYRKSSGLLVYMNLVGKWQETGKNEVFTAKGYKNCSFATYSTQAVVQGSRLVSITRQGQ